MKCNNYGKQQNCITNHTAAARREGDKKMTRNDLIIAICREAGDAGTDQEIVNGYESNYPNDYLTDVVDMAASGDVAALIRMRTDAGLRAIV